MARAFETYAHSFQVFPKLGLARISALLDALGNPQENLTYLHVAGTNGKGSVSQALYAMLMKSGYKTGLYTSPNLVRLNERIAMDGAYISDSDLAKLIDQVERAALTTKDMLGELPTPFEIWTATAFLYFAQNKCDYVVLETGLGGMYDATNIISKNKLTILTHIDYDHTAQLGTTLTSIAEAKCGIMKAGTKVFSVPQYEEVEKVIYQKAKEFSAPVCFVSPQTPTKYDGFYEVIQHEVVGEVKLSLAGIHQIENMTLAIECGLELGLTPAQIKAGIAHTVHPARMEMLKSHPPILYDGAHNPDGVSALVSSLSRYAPNVKWHLIFAAMVDKDIAPSLDILRPYVSHITCTTVQNNPRAMSAEALCEKAKEAAIPASIAPTLRDALSPLPVTPTLICGSLYLYADLPEHLRSI